MISEAQIGPMIWNPVSELDPDQNGRRVPYTGEAESNITATYNEAPGHEPVSGAVKNHFPGGES